MQMFNNWAVGTRKQMKTKLMPMTHLGTPIQSDSPTQVCHLTVHKWPTALSVKLSFSPGLWRIRHYPLQFLFNASLPQAQQHERIDDALSLKHSAELCRILGLQDFLHWVKNQMACPTCFISTWQLSSFGVQRHSRSVLFSCQSAVRMCHLRPNLKWLRFL